MFKPLILATIIAMVPATPALAKPAAPTAPLRPGQSIYDPRCVYCYYDAGAKERKEVAEIERRIAEEDTRAHVQGFASKSDHKAYHRQLVKAREQIYREKYGKK
jgi:hypothetical protein